ncbi:MAG: ABC transporter permease, partial [Gammaproteobacteria bacterium]|nr:ABC transporter permease [Gammaproteobacteria bacterium]
MEHSLKVNTIRKLAITASQELGLTLLLLFGVSIVVFSILYAAPGDAFSLLLGADQASQVKSAMGVSDGWLGQYTGWLFNIIRGDFGNSIRTGLPVFSEVVTVGFNTLYLTMAAMFVTLLIAFPIAIYTAVKADSHLSTPMTMLAYFISSLPVFWVGYIAIFVSTEVFGYFPLSVGRTQGQSMDFSQFMIPVFVLGLGSGVISEVVRSVRLEVARVMSEEYIRTARAKGAAIWKHAFKEGFLLPLTEIVAAKIPFMIGGAIIVEQVFNWPGMGRMA